MVWSCCEWQNVPSEKAWLHTATEHHHHWALALRDDHKALPKHQGREDDAAQVQHLILYSISIYMMSIEITIGISILLFVLLYHITLIYHLTSIIISLLYRIGSLKRAKQLGSKAVLTIDSLRAAPG